MRLHSCLQIFMEFFCFYSGRPINQLSWGDEWKKNDECAPVVWNMGQDTSIWHLSHLRTYLNQTKRRKLKRENGYPSNWTTRNLFWNLLHQWLYTNLFVVPLRHEISCCLRCVDRVNTKSKTDSKAHGERWRCYIIICICFCSYFHFRFHSARKLCMSVSYALQLHREHSAWQSLCSTQRNFQFHTNESFLFVFIPFYF